jgi:IS5 family transposase
LIFRKALKHMLPAGEKVHADLGYRGETKHIVVPWEVGANDVAGKEALATAASIRARHESVNKRFKQFEILKRVFRHDVQSHQCVFGACAVITQMNIEGGEPLYSIDYDESKLYVQF